MTFYSPLRYPGGKKRLVNFFEELIKKNNLEDGVYVEPYAGGASIALTLLFEGYISKAIINDLDKSIYAFWHSVLFRTEELCDLIKKTPINIKTWKTQKKIQKNKGKKDLLKLGFSTFYLNRTNYSGIINAGPIGGFKQKGKWKINSRYNKKDLIERIKKIALYRNKIELYNQDAIELIKNISKKLPENTLIYFDPPYYTKGKGLYMDHYGPEDHKEVAIGIKKIKQNWVLTYDNVPSIEQLYREYKKNKYSLGYSAGDTKKGNEIIFFSRRLKSKESILKLPNNPNHLTSP